MVAISQRAQGLGTENAFVVLAEVNQLIREGRDIISFVLASQTFQRQPISKMQASKPFAKVSTATRLLLVFLNYDKLRQTT